MGTDLSYMERAISLARRSQPHAGTNPPVGAVLVREGAIIGEGFHRGPGTPHAEAAALIDARARTGQAEAAFAGTTLYCTLEPCCHCGSGKRTPPCTEAIIEAGITRVLYACRDPNPCVAGKGAARLRSAGVQVEEGLLAERADELIEGFSVSIRLRRPFIRLKWAQSLDGRIACRGGASRWITNEQARGLAHQLRGTNDAVMVGAGTLRADNPELTVRSAPTRNGHELRQPLRVVLAGSAPLPLDARIFSLGLRERTLVLAAPGSQALAQCRGAGMHVREIAAAAGGLPDMAEAFRILYAEGIGSVLVEGGSKLLTRLLAAGLWDALTVFVAPLILGRGIEAVGDLGILTPECGIKLQDAQLQAHEGFFRFDGRNPESFADVPAPVMEGACLQG